MASSLDGDIAPHATADVAEQRGILLMVMAPGEGVLDAVGAGVDHFGRTADRCQKSAR
jgi:hypothetical protein